jgi:fimbrial chaperone protein
MLVGMPAAARAATFSVNPTQIHLSPSTTSRLLTLRNESGQVIRFQLSAFQWAQDPDGQMQLTPTTDVVFYPELLMLAPGEERRVRIGVTARAGTVEKTYRVFVQELPPLEGSEQAGGVAVLTRMGIPIFLEPPKRAAQAQLRDAALEGRRLSFALANSGTVHFVPERIHVRGLDAAGAMRFEHELNGWYILAGGHQRFWVELPVELCASIASLAIEARIGDATLSERVARPAAACSP